MAPSLRGRVVLAIGLVVVLLLAAFAALALRELQTRVEAVLERSWESSREHAAARSKWEFLARDLAATLPAALISADPVAAAGRTLEEWRDATKFDLIVLAADGHVVVTAPARLAKEELFFPDPARVGVRRRDAAGARRGGALAAQNETEIVLDAFVQPLAAADGHELGRLLGVPRSGLSAVRVDLIEPAARAKHPFTIVDRLLLGFLATVGAVVLVLLFALMRATSRLERAEALRRALVADAGHELRTPLTNLRCQIEAMEDGLQPATPAAVRSLHDETMLLVRLVDDLHVLAQADAGELTLRRGSVVLGDVVAAAEQAMQSKFAAAQVALCAERGADLPPIEGDADRLGQIARNLLENALAHARKGGRVTIVARRRDERTVALEVADDGDGIAPELLPRLFERFVRGDDSRARATGGRGLGLSIVKSLTEAHRGRVEVRSEPGRGACFTVILPLAP